MQKFYKKSEMEGFSLEPLGERGKGCYDHIFHAAEQYEKHIKDGSLSMEKARELLTEMSSNAEECLDILQKPEENKSANNRGNALLQIGSQDTLNVKFLQYNLKNMKEKVADPILEQYNTYDNKGAEGEEKTFLFANYALWMDYGLGAQTPWMLLKNIAKSRYIFENFIFFEAIKLWQNFDHPVWGAELITEKLVLGKDASQISESPPDSADQEQYSQLRKLVCDYETDYSYVGNAALTISDELRKSWEEDILVEKTQLNQPTIFDNTLHFIKGLVTQSMTKINDVVRSEYNSSLWDYMQAIGVHVASRVAIPGGKVYDAQL